MKQRHLEGDLQQQQWCNTINQAGRIRFGTGFLHRQAYLRQLMIEHNAVLVEALHTSIAAFNLITLDVMDLQEYEC